MSTAVAEKPVEFVAPTVRLGQELFWYADADKNSTPKTCVVLKLGAQTIRVRFTDPRNAGDPTKDCRYVDDPYLRANKYIERLHNEGGWDFTDDHKNREREKADMTARMNSLENRLEVMEAAFKGIEKRIK